MRAYLWIFILVVLPFALLGLIFLSGCCEYYDGFGWQPCAGYVHDNHGY